MGPPQGRAEEEENLPRPAAHTPPHAPQDPTGLLGTQGTLLAHGQQQHPRNVPPGVAWPGWTQPKWPSASKVPMGDTRRPPATPWGHWPSAGGDTASPPVPLSCD